MASFSYRLVDAKRKKTKEITGWKDKVLTKNLTAAHGRLGASAKQRESARVLLLKYWLQPITLQHLEIGKERHTSVAG